MWNRRRLLGAALGATLAGLSACSRDPLPGLHGADLSGSRMGMDFTLTDPDGRAVSLSDFRGKVVMIFFGFTQCPDVCPTALARAAHVRSLLGPDADQLQVLFVTLDPERDTPEVLADYARAFDPSFIALRGTPAQIDEVAGAFKVFHMRVPAGDTYTIDHTAYSYLYDRKGKLRVGLRHEQSAQAYVDDVRRLLAL